MKSSCGLISQNLRVVRVEINQFFFEILPLPCIIISFFFNHMCTCLACFFDLAPVFSFLLGGWALAKLSQRFSAKAANAP